MMVAAPSTAFSDRDGQIWMDGAFVPWREAQVHVLTHALHYGGAVFEGMRAYDGHIFALDAHSERLLHSADTLGYAIPWSKDEINRICNDALKANNLKDAYVRPIAWRGSEQMGVAAQKAKIHLSISCWAWGAYFGEEALNKGLRLGIARWRRPAPYTIPATAKASGLYMICTLSKHEAQAAGYDDALMFDWRGRVAESTGSNIFFVKDGVLHTPVPDCFLAGITRATVIRLAKARGIPVEERPIWPEELEGFEQCFVTGSAAEVVPVGSIGPWTFEVGAMTRQLMQDYSAFVRGKLTLPAAA